MAAVLRSVKVEIVEIKNSMNTARVAFLAALLAVAVGCSREGGAPQASTPDVSPSAPESYMKDKTFRAKLDGQVAKRGELASARNAIVAQMSEMIEAKRKELGIAGAPGSALSTEDEAKLKAALEKDPAWNELYKRCEDANTAIVENRRETMAAVRERLTRRGTGNGESAFAGATADERGTAVDVKPGNLK